jgi:hypothetical protein
MRRHIAPAQTFYNQIRKYNRLAGQARPQASRQQRSKE